MDRDLDIDFEEPIDSDFKENIKNITSEVIVGKIKYPGALYTFHFNGELKNSQVNIARFMMEGMGFPAKYWLCTGINTLHDIMECNMEDGHYNELIKMSARRDVLCLKGLPLFYSVEHSLGDNLLLVSDIKKSQVRISCFQLSVETSKTIKVIPAKKTTPQKRKKQKAKPGKYHGDLDDDYSDDEEADDIPF